LSLWTYAPVNQILGKQAQGCDGHQAPKLIRESGWGHFPFNLPLFGDC
jgi:hypothetical protein